MINNCSCNVLKYHKINTSYHCTYRKHGFGSIQRLALWLVKSIWPEKVRGETPGMEEGTEILEHFRKVLVVLSINSVSIYDCSPPVWNNLLCGIDVSNLCLFLSIVSQKYENWKLQIQLYLSVMKMRKRRKKNGKWEPNGLLKTQIPLKKCLTLSTMTLKTTSLGTTTSTWQPLHKVCIYSCNIYIIHQLTTFLSI